jgi:hypothetical protein
VAAALGLVFAAASVTWAAPPPRLGARNDTRRPAPRTGLPEHTGTVEAPKQRGLLSTILPETVRPSTRPVVLPDQKDGISYTRNQGIRSAYARVLVPPGRAFSHDGLLDAIMKGRPHGRNGRDMRSGLYVGGINWGGRGAHTSSDNIDKTSYVRGQASLAVAEDQLQVRLHGAVPVRPNTNVLDLMERIGKGQVVAQELPTLGDLRIPEKIGGRKIEGLVLTDYYDISDGDRVAKYIDMVRNNPNVQFDKLLDPITEPNDAFDAASLVQVKRLVDANLPNLRMWVARLGEQQQLQHRKILNRIYFRDLDKLAQPGKRVVLQAMSGVMPVISRSFPTQGALAQALEQSGTVTIDEATYHQLGAQAVADVQRQAKYPGSSLLVEMDPRTVAAPDRTVLDGAGVTVVPKGGAIQFRGILKLQDLANQYIETLAEWAKPQGLHLRIQGQDFVFTDRGLTDAVEKAIQAGGEAKVIVDDLKIDGTNINESGVERLVQTGAQVRYFEASTITRDLAQRRAAAAADLGISVQQLGRRYQFDHESMLHGKSLQVEVVDATGKPIDWRKVKAADRTAWDGLWAQTGHPALPAGSLQIDGSANFSGAGKEKNFEIRYLTVDRPEGVARTTQVMHEPVWKHFSEDVKVPKFLRPDQVTNSLFQHAAPPAAAIDGQDVVYLSLRGIYERFGEAQFNFRFTLENNELVQLGYRTAGLRTGAGGLELDAAQPSEGVLVNPAPTFDNQPRTLHPDLERFYGIKPADVAQADHVERVINGLVPKLRALEQHRRPVLVTFGAQDEKAIDRLNRDGRRVGVNEQNQFQIRNEPILDVQEALHELFPQDRNISRSDATTRLGLTPVRASGDAGASSTLEMLPKVIGQLRAAGHPAQTIGDLLSIMKPGSHVWNRSANRWDRAPAGRASP